MSLHNVVTTKSIDRFLLHIELRYLVRYGFISNLLLGKTAVYFKMTTSVVFITVLILWEKGCSLQIFNLFKGRESEISKIYCCATFNLEIGGKNSSFPTCTGWLKVTLRNTVHNCWSYVHRTLDLLVQQLWFLIFIF